MSDAPVVPITREPVQPTEQDRDDSYVVFDSLKLHDVLDLLKNGELNESTVVLIKRTSRVPKDAAKRTKRDNLERVIEEVVREDDAEGKWKEGRSYATARHEYYLEATPAKKVNVSWGL